MVASVAGTEGRVLEGNEDGVIEEMGEIILCAVCNNFGFCLE